MSNNPWKIEQQKINPFINKDGDHGELGTPVNGVVGNAVDAVQQVGNALGSLANAPYLVDTTGGGNDRTLQTVSTIGEALKENPIVNNPALQAASARFIYASSDAVKANAALDYASKLNIGADAILNSGETGFTRAAYLANQVDRGRTVQSLYDEYPELYKVKYGSQSEAIYGLENLQSVKSTHGIWDSIQQNIWSINDQMKLGDAGYELSNTTDPKKIEELTNEIQRLQTNLSNYRHADGMDVAQSVIGETAGQGYMMAKQGGIGAVAGAVAGALIGGLATEGVGATAGAATGAKWGGGADMAYNMYKMSFGNKYVELIQKKDANGNRVYTDQEANQYAMSYAAIDAGIEFAATAAMGKAVKAVAPKGMIAKAISAGVGDTVKTFDRGIGTTVAQMAKNSIKAGVPELFEEGLQDINEKVQHNLTRKDNDLEGYYSVGDIAIGSLDAMKQALPAVIGFGAIGGAVGGVRTAKAFRDFQKLTPEQQQAAIIAEQNRNGAVIMDNVRKDSATNKIAKENPELYGKIVQAQGDKVGVSTQYVDVAELVQSENGQLAIRDMIDNGLVTQEEVKAAIEADAPVEIPIGSYAQVSMNLSDETVEALKQTSYFTRGGMSLATLERAKQEVDVAKSVLKDDTSKRAERIKDDIIRNEFEGASDIDREVLNEVLADPTNIKRNYNNLLHTLKEQYRETYASDFDNADASINDAVTTGIEPQWLTDYKANNGGKAPRTNAERRRAAYEYSRATTTASLDGNADALAQSDAHYADMEHMLMQIESLEAMKDKVFEIADKNVALRMNLTKAGHEVYTKVRELLETSTKGHIRQQAHEDALLVATHADVFARIMREAGNARYTAMDYLNTVRFDVNAGLKGKDGYAQAAWHGSPHDFDEFDLGAIGSGEGNQAHGWGLYFAKSKRVSDNYKKTLKKLHNSETASLFKVDIPSEKTMLDENVPFDKQTKIVKDAITENLKKLSDEEKNTIYYKHIINTATELLDVDYENKKYDLGMAKSDIDIFRNVVVAGVRGSTGADVNRAELISKENGYNLNDILNDTSLESAKNVLEKLTDKANKLEIEFKKLDKEEIDRVNKSFENIGSILEKHTFTGREIYNALSDALGGDKAASQYLNSIGVLGITYDGREDGRCYVVFDDKAVKVIEKYNQSINGMTTIKSQTERIVELFKTADKSTFMHEMGHVFFDDIKTLAEMENAPQQVKDDWQALKEWSGWNDNETINTDAHEKFARGFEAYLREGEAPTKFLERTFRRFSKWLSAIYRAVSRLGGLPPKEIREIMDRMLATQDDIEAYAEQQQLEQFEKTELYKQLSEQDQARMQSYIADVKEKAKERVMRKLMKELDNRPIKEWEEEKDVIQIEIEKRLIEQYPIYKEHQRYNVFGAGALKDTQYNSIEELEKAEVEQTGATFNDAINQEMDNAKAEFMKDNNVGKTNEQIAEEILLSTQGQMKLTEEESKIIQQSTNRELAKNWELLERIRKLDPNAETIDTELSEIEKEVKPTKYDILKSDKKKVDAALVDTTKELEKAERLIEKLNNEKAELTDKAKEREGELKDKNSELSKRLTTITNQLDRAIEQKERLAERTQERAEKQELKASERIEKLKDELQERINNVRSIRGAGLGTISDYMNRARKELGELPISNAIQFKTYQNKAVTAGKKADRALASGKVDKALGYKREQMLQQARARVAFENFEKSKKLRLKLKQQLQRMTRHKNPIAIEPNMRYFYAHMAYQMGLTKYDGLEPTDGFDMNTVLSALDVDALILNQQSMVQLQPWIAEMFYAKTPKSFKSITMNELEILEELMTGMYKNGRNEYEGTTILNDEGKSVSFENAVQEIIGEATETFGGATGDVFNILNNQTKTDAVSGKLYGFHLALMKVETFLRRMGGGKNGFAVKYIYDPISRATQAFNERKEVSMRRLAKDVGIYSKRELFNMRNEHLYTVGNLYGLTKEQLIMIALNWGTESNRQRVMETTKANEVEIERAFQEHMTDKDWEFVIRTWDHINSFFDERSKVQEELYGNPLKKVEGLSFSIGGRNIEGQYFPIVYNPKVNASVSDNQVEDIAKTMVSSNAVWGTGMSATKSRLDVVKDKSLLLDFDVIPNAITEAINHVTMRKAVTDVNKLISNRELQNYIVDKFGADTYQFLRTWVRDNWQDEAAKTNDIDRLILTLKKNTSTAVMAGRVSVALQNALNIPVAFYRIGVGNTIRAINHAGIGFYGHGTTTYNNTRDFVLGQSIFMRERVQTLDKDLKQGLSIAGKGLRLGDTNVGGYKVEQLADIRDDINQMGFRLLTETDFALSIPVWKFAYDQKQAELFGKEGVSAEWVEQQSIEAGDRAVRDIFGSGDTKDSAAIQRSRSTFTQLFVPFYSYANTLYNIITEGNYARKDNGDYARFVKMLWWTLISQAIGMMAYKAMTNGDDDKPEDLAKSFIEELVAQGTMGVPIIRDMSNMAMKYILGEKVFNKGNSVMALSIVEKFYDLGNAIMSDKKDGIDVGRSFSQLANRATGFSDTVTDGLWALAKFGFTDTDASLEDVIMAVAFDRRLKTKKEKKKQH
uniref:Crystallin beta/gamma motif-containing protein n=1 Tax=Podoviridae sp. ctf5T2 TaxID=2827743 RepID=A0A8S5SLD0_9CAUD|nr:MAG TPA: crystallin beta/gamma motif-containing protein [Podoviridae sp. ctf5T2]